MKAPEKIFICDYGSEIGYEWHSESEFETKGHNDIEYTRTDAFIEKACAFLKDRIEHDSIDYPMATHYLIEDFRKYMKGE